MSSTIFDEFVFGRQPLGATGKNRSTSESYPEHIPVIQISFQRFGAHPWDLEHIPDPRRVPSDHGVARYI